MQTVLCDQHIALGAEMTEFAGWEMPLRYPEGIVTEHLQTRSGAGLFDVSHMGRIEISGESALPFLEYVLTNRAGNLAPGSSHYTIISTERGGALDDAYLYRFNSESYLLVVNASNRHRDLLHLKEHSTRFKDVVLVDQTMETAMVSLQGPKSEELLASTIGSGGLPPSGRNSLTTTEFRGETLQIGRTGYTGEPICFELICSSDNAPSLWANLIEAGASPIGLGARDTLRIEAGLPLYGHELGVDKAGAEIPVYSIPFARFAVELSEDRGEFIGKDSLVAQSMARIAYQSSDYSTTTSLPRMIKPFTLLGRGIPRQGCRVFCQGREVGCVTSGTMAPYWIFDSTESGYRITDECGRRAIGLGLLESELPTGSVVDIEIRGKQVSAQIVASHVVKRAPQYARPLLL